MDTKSLSSRPNVHRLIAIMPDGAIFREVSPKKDPHRDLIHWFGDIKVIQNAVMILSVDLVTGETEVLKNTWGKKGKVVNSLETKLDSETYTCHNCCGSRTSDKCVRCDDYEG